MTVLAGLLLVGMWLVMSVAVLGRDRLLRVGAWPARRTGELARAVFESMGTPAQRGLLVARIRLAWYTYRCWRLGIKIPRERQGKSRRGGTTAADRPGYRTRPNRQTERAEAIKADPPRED